MRHSASVSPQPQVQSSALSALIASVRFAGVQLRQVDAGNRRRLRGVLEPDARRIVDALDPCVRVQPGQHLRFELGLLRRSTGRRGAARACRRGR